MSDPFDPTGYKDTSREAWQESESTEQSILMYLEEYGPATDEEIEIAFDLTVSRSARPSRTALRNEGLVRDSGKRRDTLSNRSAIVWELTPGNEIEAQRMALAPYMLKKRIKRMISSLEIHELIHIVGLIKSLDQEGGEAMPEARWFLAHSKSETLPVVEHWSSLLCEQLTQPGWRACVTSGRDDYALRAHAVGGWKRWCKDVPRCQRYDGEPMFHGIVIPVDLIEPLVGRATALLIGGFIDNNKYAYAWDTSSNEFSRVVGVDETGLDDWTAWGRLAFAPIP